MILILFLSVAVVAAPDCSLDGDWLVATVHTWNSPPKLRPIIIWERERVELERMKNEMKHIYIKY